MKDYCDKICPKCGRLLESCSDIICEICEKVAEMQTWVPEDIEYEKEKKVFTTKY